MLSAMPRAPAGRARPKCGTRGLLLLGAALITLAGCTTPGSPNVIQAVRQQAERAGLSAVRAGLTGRRHGPVFYLALGDSLARGIQPGPAGSDTATTRGYADRIARRLRDHLPSLRLVELGCSGETTSSMIHGGICGYRAGSQLAQAVDFLRSHRGRIALVTIDIGANDPNTCVIGVAVSAILGCLLSRVPQTEANLQSILAALRAAAGRRVLIVGMTYYVPELGLWKTGRNGKIVAVLTEGFAAGVNKLLTVKYQRYGARVANVFAAFRSNDFANAVAGPGRFRPMRTAPPNVTAICALTWMCVPGPRGPNEHANDAGYRLIAQTFWRAITG